MAERRLHILNNSRAAAFRRCPRLHCYGYELGFFRRDKAEALEVGTRWHRSLEAWWRAVQKGWRDEALDAALSALEPTDDRYEQIRAETVLAGYHARWIDVPLEVLGVEVSFEGPLLDPITGDEHPTFRLGGTLDAIVRTIEGRVLVVEHKTSSQDFSPGSYYWEKLTLNSQVSQYVAAGPALSLPIQGCLYDVIGKAPDISPRLATPETDRKYTKDGKLYARQRDADEDTEEFRARLLDAIAEDPGKFYGRGEIVRLGNELEDAQLDVWQLAELVSEARELARWPRNTDSCFAFSRECDFFSVCARGAPLEVGEMFDREVQS